MLALIIELGAVSVLPTAITITIAHVSHGTVITIIAAYPHLCRGAGAKPKFARIVSTRIVIIAICILATRLMGPRKIYSDILYTPETSLYLTAAIEDHQAFCCTALCEDQDTPSGPYLQERVLICQREGKNRLILDFVAIVSSNGLATDKLTAVCKLRGSHQHQSHGLGHLPGSVVRKNKAD